MTEFFSILSPGRMVPKSVKFPAGTMTDKNIIPLIEAKMGQSLRIHSLPQGKLRTYFLRLGISEGDIVVCHERLPGGTVVLRKNRQEVAIGHKLAAEISVIVVNKEKAA
jgi:ferrous iron transport protein A